MERNIILAGVGGQGVLTVALGLSTAAMRRGWRVQQGEIHGMSQRGGAVQAHLRIADHELHSALIPRGRCDAIVATEPLEALRYVEYLSASGCIISATEPFVNIPNYPAVEELLERIARFPGHVLLGAARLAKAAGSALAVNSVMLGAASLLLDFDPAELEEVLAEAFRRKGEHVVQVNQRALHLGRSAAQAYRGAVQRGLAAREARAWLDALPPEQLVAAEPAEALATLPIGYADELTQAERGAVSQALAAAAQAGRTQLYEHEVYDLVELVGAIRPPRHEFLARGQHLTPQGLASFPGDKVVLKLVSPDVTHKTEARAVVFVPKEPDTVNREIDRLIARQEEAGAKVDGVLLVEYVPAAEAGFGHELFVGIRATREFGPVIAAGLGGVDTEYLASKMRPGIAVAKALATETTAEEFFELFRQTAAYELLTGQVRGHRRIVSNGELIRCFRAFIALARAFSVHRPGDGPDLRELEVNPFAFVNQAMIPLDGRATVGRVPAPDVPRPLDKTAALLEPKSICVVGVSTKRTNFARVILNNIQECGFPVEHLYVLKPDAAEIDGARCIASLAAAPEPIDLLVVAAAASSVVALVQEAVACGKVTSVILIPGALGETEGSRELAGQLRGVIAAGRRRPDGGPIVLGGNCMGVRSRPGRYDTFFIPKDKLDPRRAEPAQPLAIVAQSGAFAITRMSNFSALVPQLAVTVGNQTDLTIADMLWSIVPREDVRVVGVYVEGFRDLDGLACVRAIRALCAAGKEVVFYKAGRTASGRTAMTSHTASIAGDYDVCLTAAEQAGALVVDTVKEFEQVVEMATIFRDRRVGGRRIGVISNAGFETVCMADAALGPRYAVELPELSEATVLRLQRKADTLGLASLVSVRNPLDLNPMSGEEMYEASVRAFLEDSNLDAVIVSIVPFTPQLLTTPDEIVRPESIAHRLGQIAREHAKPLAAVIDCGAPFDRLAAVIRGGGVPVLPSCDQAVRSLGRLLCHRTRLQARTPRGEAATSAMEPQRHRDTEIAQRSVQVG